MRFHQKTAIITGAGCGIGLEIARQFCAEGGQLVLNDIDEQLGAEAVARLNADRAGACHLLAGDAGDPYFTQSLVEAAVDHFGRLDIVVANAGITLFGDFLSYTPEAFNRVMQVNLTGSFFLVQSAARQMKLQQEGGSMLLMSSVTGHQAHKQLAAYGMSKAALEMMARNLVVELSPLHININAIAPGATLTERTEQDAGYQRTWSSLTPMGKPAHVSEIAAAALFLVSDAARHITGQSLVVDGGWTSVSPQP
ncbi:MAG: glucose 1-dehydrogenase [Chitinophagaceae bacterium]|nr:glucose 1-dehydrogenase [Chitinophagaceae bacterium]